MNNKEPGYIGAVVKRRRDILAKMEAEDISPEEHARLDALHTSIKIEVNSQYPVSVSECMARSNIYYVKNPENDSVFAIDGTQLPIYQKMGYPVVTEADALKQMFNN